MGRWLEHLVGRVVVLATILWSMLLSSVGALVIDVAGVTIGASGVAFGLVGCAVAADPRARTATGLIARQLMVVNIIITFLAPGISIGGHLGGLLAGLAVGAACWMRGPLPDHPAGRARRAAGIVAIAVASPLCLLLAIGPRALPGELRAARGAIVAPLLERQLSGATLTNGRELDEARCSATDEPQRYRCVIDGEPTTIRFDSGTDQWAISSS